MNTIDKCIIEYKEKKLHFEMFMDNICKYFLRCSIIADSSPCAIHSIKYRLKDEDHVREKLLRKQKEKRISINTSNMFNHLTDLAGVRILHMHHYEFPTIHNVIKERVDSGEWHLKEKPIAYSWDPEYSDYFKNFGITSQIKADYYTSVHYVISPKKNSYICCEVQVRTLFEEIWGEVSHKISYPNICTNDTILEQLKVLARLSSTGTRLVNSIFKSQAPVASKKTTSKTVTSKKKAKTT